MERYPKNYEWVHNIPEEDLKWFTDLVAIITDNCDVYDLETRSDIAKFLSSDQGECQGLYHECYYRAIKELNIPSIAKSQGDEVEDILPEYYDELEATVLILMKDPLICSFKLLNGTEVSDMELKETILSFFEDGFLTSDKCPVTLDSASVLFPQETFPEAVYYINLHLKPGFNAAYIQDLDLAFNPDMEEGNLSYDINLYHNYITITLISKP